MLRWYMCSAPEVRWQTFLFFFVDYGFDGGGDLNSGPQRIRQPNRVDLE